MREDELIEILCLYFDFDDFLPIILLMIFISDLFPNKIDSFSLILDEFIDIDGTFTTHKFDLDSLILILFISSLLLFSILLYHHYILRIMIDNHQVGP